ADSITIVIDTIPPRLSVDEPTDGDTVSPDGFTVSGTAEPGATVTVFVDGDAIGTVVAAEDGTWSVDVGGPLDEGASDVTVTATDAAGNTTVIDLGVIVEEDASTTDLPPSTEEPEFDGLITGGGPGCSAAPGSPNGLIFLWLVAGLLLVRRKNRN
ncbi:MAG: hypothetical protein EA398_01030, partial [Deltaproteobacteria bacterium]